MTYVNFRRENINVNPKNGSGNFKIKLFFSITIKCNSNNRYDISSKAKSSYANEDYDAICHCFWKSAQKSTFTFDCVLILYFFSIIKQKIFFFIESVAFRRVSVGRGLYALYKSREHVFCFVWRIALNIESMIQPIDKQSKRLILCGLRRLNSL